MTTLKPDGLMEELKPCPFCGAEPSFDYDEEITECNEIKCSLTKEMHSSTWQNAYCWKLLTSERVEAEKRIAAYRKVVGGLLHQMKIINGDNEKCVLPEYCLNHLLINEAERLMKEETK